MTTAAERPIVDFRAVRKTFTVAGQALDVLAAFDLAIRDGEFLAIVGASGCGKSTLLRLLVGLDDRYDGDILIDGRRITGVGRDRGIVFQ
ncbi:ATP-binding cassette domain-containing protein, partial [Klebsiella pneumoniae]|uniref:ATP-binding cassette domain-containing protein n=1 Tax=Klebsiella pneumoniae TaxID=573 RepID=UPI003EE24854